MGSLVAELSNNEIISAETAVNLRRYVALRNPELSVVMRAGIFADAVNRIVDSRLTGFNAELAQKLKGLLFRDITIKSEFAIDCADVFKASVKLKTTSLEFIQHFNDWLSAVLNEPVDRESLFDFVLQTHKLLELKPDVDIIDILNSVEQGTGGLKYAGQQPESVAATIIAEIEVKDDDRYDFGENIREYIRLTNDNRTSSLSRGENGIRADTGNRPAYNRNNIYRSSPSVIANIISRLSSSLIKQYAFPEPGRLLMTSAAAAVVVFSMAFAGYTKASPYKSDIYGLSPISAAAYTAAPGMVDFNYIQSAGYAAAQETNMELFKEDSSMVRASIKRMKATAYDLSVESCGKRPEHPQYGITSSGTKATAGRTIAVDPRVVPLGSRVHISFPQEYSHLDGVYIAEDTGRLIQGDEIDIFFGEDKQGGREIYESAMKFGVRYVDVKVLD